MIPFPDDRQLPRSQDGSEPILNGSVGLNRILLMLKGRPLIDRAPAWGLYLVNAATVFRNVHSSWKPTDQFIKTLTDQEAIKLFQQDVALYITYINAYLSTFSTPPQEKYPIVIYYPNYGKIPTTIRREPAGKESTIWAQYERIRRLHISPTPAKTAVNEYTEAWELPVGYGTYPHIELQRWIQRFLLDKGTPTLYRWDHHKALIMSHCAIDLHAKIPKLELVESYQGVIKDRSQFYTKLSVPKENPIPFTALTHQLFGDSTLIKGKVSGKNKGLLLKDAQTSRWMTAGSETIMRNAVRIAGVLPTEFVSF